MQIASMFVVLDDAPEKTSFFSYLAAIVGEAAKTPRGILALVIIVIGLLAFYYFRNDPVKYKLIVFVLLLVTAVPIGYVALHEQVAPPTGGGLTKVACGQLLRSKNRGSDPLALTIFNSTPRTRKDSWLEDSGKKTLMTTLKPDEQSNWTTYQNDVWEVDDESASCIGLYRIGDEKTQDIVIRD